MSQYRIQAAGRRPPRARCVVLGASQNASVFPKGDVSKRALVLEWHANGFARLRVQELGCAVVTCRQELVAMFTHADAVNTTTMLPRFADSLAIHRALSLWP